MAISYIPESLDSSGSEECRAIYRWMHRPNSTVIGQDQSDAMQGRADSGHVGLIAYCYRELGKMGRNARTDSRP